MGDAERSERKGAAAAAGAEQAASTLSFEGALEQLEGTLARLEEGDLPLEEALELFEDGVRLSRHCTATLEAAERRIEILMADREDEAGATLRPFDVEEDEEIDESEEADSDLDLED